MERKHGPWVIREMVQKYKNPWIEVREDQVTRPDGTPGTYGVVAIRPGTSVLPFDDKGYVFLTREFRYAIGRKSVEVVSGGIDAEETPEEAGRRELREELGIEAGEWTCLGVVDPFTAVVCSPATLYLARHLTRVLSAREGTEMIEELKVRLDDAVAMVMDSRITHGPSCVLILKAYAYLKK